MNTAEQKRIDFYGDKDSRAYDDDELNLMKEYAKEYHEAELKKLGLCNDIERFYQIDFGNHLRCKIKVADSKTSVEYAINGWGDIVPLNQVIIIKNP